MSEVFHTTSSRYPSSVSEEFDGFQIRPATRSDIPAIQQLIIDLAIYEKEPDAVEGSEADLERELFGQNPVAHCHVAEVEGKVVGIALWYLNYSTWKASAGIYLEDLYVQPEQRGKGIGLALIKTLAKLCVERGYPRFQWWVLNWNQSAIDFYKKIGAVPMDEWTTFRLSEEALVKFASGE